VSDSHWANVLGWTRIGVSIAGSSWAEVPSGTDTASFDVGGFSTGANEGAREAERGALVRDVVEESAWRTLVLVKVIAAGAEVTRGALVELLLLHHVSDALCAAVVAALTRLAVQNVAAVQSRVVGSFGAESWLLRAKGTVGTVWAVLGLVFLKVAEETSLTLCTLRLLLGSLGERVGGRWTEDRLSCAFFAVVVVRTRIGLFVFF
jgi:hypothetical protein